MPTNDQLSPNDKSARQSLGSANDAAKNGDYSKQSAIELARSKLDRLYTGAPDAKRELEEVSEELAEHKTPSRHEQYMLELKASGKSMAEIQSAWHDYYQSLNDDDKRAVWREFYERAGNISWPATSTRHHKTSSKKITAQAKPDAIDSTSSTGVTVGILAEENNLPPKPKPIARARRIPKPPRRRLKTRPARTSKTVSFNTDAKRQLRAKHNLQSLAFGLATGLVVILIFMFSFFNQRFIVPFIRPGTASATPIILSPSSLSPTKNPEIIIPKINLEIPLVFSVDTTNESDIETGLESGVVHYPTTVLPGQAGNSAYFGHSSNNIFSPGNYKFAFALLHELKKGDTFYITYNKKVYVYKVYDRQIVSPSDVGVLDNVPNKTATATLITCDPPGTSLNRLVVWGEQISPAPSANSQPKPANSTNAPNRIVGNGPSLWDRIF